MTGADVELADEVLFLGRRPDTALSWDRVRARRVLRGDFFPLKGVPLCLCEFLDADATVDDVDDDRVRRVLALVPSHTSLLLGLGTFELLAVDLIGRGVFFRGILLLTPGVFAGLRSSSFDISDFLDSLSSSTSSKTLSTVFCLELILCFADSSGRVTLLIGFKDGE